MGEIPILSSPEPTLVHFMNGFVGKVAMTKYALRALWVLALAAAFLASCGKEEIPPAPLFSLVTVGDLPSLGATYGGTFLDLNADGLLDVLMGDPALETALFLNGGQLTFAKTTPREYSPLAGSEFHGAAACDFDRDGDWDYIFPVTVSNVASGNTGVTAFLTDAGTILKDSHSFIIELDHG